MSQYSPLAEKQGILLVDKPRGMVSFELVRILRRRLNVKTIGHAGTLDPFATGVMVMLVGRNYTRLSNTYLNDQKEYVATVKLGEATDTFDCDGEILITSELIPSLQQIQEAIQAFQGEIDQLPPMYSAKKVQGKKLYELARQGIEVERKTCKVHLDIEILSYDYPLLKIRVVCSKGTYIRSLAHEIGGRLGCGGHLTELERTRSGAFHIKDCLDGELLTEPSCVVEDFLRK